MLSLSRGAARFVTSNFQDEEVVEVHSDPHFPPRSRAPRDHLRVSRERTRPPEKLAVNLLGNVAGVLVPHAPGT